MKTKVCHISTAHSRKDIRIFLKEASTLASLGNYEVHYLVADGLNDEIINNVRISSISKPRRRLNRFIFSSFSMLKKAKGLSAEIYHIHDPELFWLTLPLKRIGSKVILDLHEDLPRQILSKPYLPKITLNTVSFLSERYEDFFISRSNAIITATPFIAEIHKNKNNEVICVSNFPLNSEFLNYKKSDKNIEKRDFCYTGGITEIRGLTVLLDALEESKDDWILHLAGPIASSNLKLRIEEIEKNSGRIKYWGVVGRNQLYDIFSQCLAGFVTFLPVPNHINAVPNKMFEYMSAGLPVICSSFESWKAIVEEEHVGITVDPSDKMEILSAINYLRENKKQADFLGENGKKAVIDRFNWEKESVNLIELYKRIDK